MKRPLALVLLAVLTLPAGAARAASDVAVGDVVFHAFSNGFALSDGAVSRTWTIGPIPYENAPVNTAYTTSLRDRRTGVDYSAGGAPEFEIDLGTSGATARRISSFDLPFLGYEATALSNGVAVALRFGADTGAGVALDVVKTVTLYQDTAAFQSDLRIDNLAPVAARVAGARFDEVDATGTTLRATTIAFSGGSDWRDDFRHQRAWGALPDDTEGEVMVVGADRGFFFASERRGGAASRVGSNGATAWIGVDYTRDLEDLGPLATKPPAYNRVENPAYPVPARGRLLAPLSSLVLGRTVTGVFAGGEQGAAAAYVDYLVRDRQPAYHHDVTLNSFHPWSHGTDYNGTTMERQADVLASIGADEIILDDQWQGGAGGESGDWHFDPARFPDADGNGIPDAVEYIHAKGMKLGLWMSPAEFNSASQTFAAHPQWACTPVGTATSQVPDDAGLGVWDFNNADLRAYMTGVIDRLVHDYGVAEFKFDFQTWVDCPPYDYNDYEAAFASWVDDLETRHPDVSFEFDETNDQRMWALESSARGASWFDNFHTHYAPDGSKELTPAEALHDVWSAAPWVPPATLGVGVFDNDSLTQSPYPIDFQLAVASLTHWTFWTDMTKLTQPQLDETAWWIDWYHTHSAELGGLVYRLTEADPHDMTSAAAFEPWDGDHGYLFAFRQSGDAPVVALQGVDPGSAYTLTNVRDGAILGTFPGWRLRAGITPPLDAPYTSAVYRITRA